MLRWTIVSMLAFVAASNAAAQRGIQDSHCTGVLHGIISDQDGRAVEAIDVVLWPLGIDLAYVLPEAKTNQAGEYRFEQLCPGRYSVVPRDDKAGYRDLNPLYLAFLSGRRIEEAKLTREKSQAELSLRLPPVPGDIRLSVSDHVTGAEVSSFGVRMVIPGQRHAPKMEVWFNPKVSNRDIEVPPDKDFRLEITADGFRRWNEIIGGPTIRRIQAGAQENLSVQLEPRKPGKRVVDAVTGQTVLGPE